MSTPTKFEGLLTMTSTSDDFARKDIPGFRFNAVFEPDGRWHIPAAGFRHVQPDIETRVGKVDLVVTLVSDAEGTWDAKSLAIEIAANFRFEIELLLTERSSTLALEFDATSERTAPTLTPVTGTLPDRATGTLGLAAAGRFNGTLLDNEDCLVRLQGTFDPNPWA